MNSNFTIVSPADFSNDIQSMPNAYILDVRTPDEYAGGHIQGAHELNWLDRQTFDEGAKSLPKDKTLFVYCGSGVRSAQASEYLASQGFTVEDLDGGFAAWQKAFKA